MQTEYRQNEKTPLTASALEIAERVRARDWSARAVVDAHIARIEHVNPLLNAVVATRFDEARAEARAADALDDHARQQRPLLGVPFTVKEMIELTGMPSTFGTESRRGRISHDDATVIARLRAAGAIPLGVTNLPEWGMWFESYNHIYGRTRNPWNPKHTPGGSSGGEGAIVGAGGSVFGIGSDIGGSARMPAAFCGVFAHKPTNGLLPLTGHYPVYRDIGAEPGARRAPYVTIGPLTRSAHDLMPLLRIMAGDDGVDHNTEPVPLRDVESVGWENRRVVLLPSPRISRARRASAELSQLVEDAGARLRALGARIEYAPPDVFRHTRNAWFAALQSGSAQYFEDVLTDGRGLSLGKEIARALVGRSRYSWPALFFAIGERIGRKAERPLHAALRQLEEVQQRYIELLGDDGVLIMPVHPRAAPRHNEPVLHPFDFLYTAIFNALRAPATVAPCGLSRSGLPLALQIAAVRGNDHLTIAAACVFERELRAWQPAPVLHR